MKSNETKNGEGFKMQDSFYDSLVVNFGTFSDTEAEVHAINLPGREFMASMFGAGAFSVTLPKSRAQDFITFAERKGMQVAKRLSIG